MKLKKINLKNDKKRIKRMRTKFDIKIKQNKMM